MNEKKKIYFHPKQLEIMRVGANSLYLIAPRGWGKSEGVDAPILLRNITSMPRSCGAILSPTYGKLLRNTLPAVCRSLTRLGYHRNKHYVLGHRADKKLNFKTPHTEPFDWEYTMHWFNGSVLNLLSFDRPMSANSMNLDYVMGFEAKFLDYEKITNEVVQANRGNEELYMNCPYHHGYTFTTDMPTRKSGMWIFEKEKEMHPEIIEAIFSCYHEAKRLEYYDLNPQRAAKIRKELFEYRKNATLYIEADPIDNIDLLRERFFKDMKRTLPPFLYQTSILNKRIRKLENGFYSSLNENIHYYDAYDNSFLHTLNYDLNKAAELDCRKDSDMDPEKPLYIALDYNANINCLIVAQPDYEKKILRTIKEFYVKGDNRLKQLLENFNIYYKIRANKDVIYYYSHTALQGAYAMSAETFADAVQSILMSLDWTVNPVYMGQAPKHELKHRYINDGLKGTGNLFPMFNRDNTESLLIAMEQTGVKINPNGWGKDKSGEKLDETPEDQLQHRTDITDAWDELYMGCVLSPIEFVSSGGPSIMGSSRS